MAHYAKSLGSTLDEPVVVADENGQTIATAGGEECDNETMESTPDIGVRRLTPVECERLQGFPDNWTLGQSHVSRYRMLGNAVAVPVVEWIAKRLVDVDERMESGIS